MTKPFVLYDFDEVYFYRGGTPFAVVSETLGYLLIVGSWTEPAVSRVPRKDAESFEALLKEHDVKFHKLNDVEANQYRGFTR